MLAHEASKSTWIVARGRKQQDGRYFVSLAARFRRRSFLAVLRCLAQATFLRLFKLHPPSRTSGQARPPLRWQRGKRLFGQYDAGVDGDGAVGIGEHGIQVEFGDFGMGVDELRDLEEH
jgi:hypothetical protein